MELAFQYFFMAGAAVGLGVSLTVIPAWMLKNKIENGGFKKRWGKQRK